MLTIEILNPEQVGTARAHLHDTGAVKWSDGKSTAGDRARRVKNNQQAAAGVSGLQGFIAKALLDNGAFAQNIRPVAMTTPLFSRYTEGMEYGPHIDAPMAGDGKCRIDVAVTLFLSDPASYDGGELCAEGQEPVKLPAGHAVVYPASTLHRVNPVTRGERLAAVCWVQSRVRDAAQRQLLMELGSVYATLQANDPEGPATDLALKVYSNLSRMWLD